MFKFVYEEKYEKSLWTIGFGVCMGILIIVVIIWNRLIREHLPREILSEQSTVVFYIVLLMFLFSLVLVTIYVYKIQKKIRGITSHSSYIKKFMNYLKGKPTLIDICQFIINYIIFAPLFLWRFVYFNLSLKYRLQLITLFYKLGIFLYNYIFPYASNVLYRHLIALITFVYLPRILTFSVFFYEILIMRKLEYFYHCFIILCIPLIFLSLRRILLDISYFELEKLQQGFIKVLSREVVCHRIGRESFTITKLHPDMPEDVYQIAVDNLRYFYEILLFSSNSFKISEKYDIIGSLITYILLVAGFASWILIIFKLI